MCSSCRTFIPLGVVKIIYGCLLGVCFIHNSICTIHNDVFNMNINTYVFVYININLNITHRSISRGANTSILKDEMRKIENMFHFDINL